MHKWNQDILDLCKNNKFLITGGAGFIGSSIANKIAECGGIVTVLDDLSTGDKLNLNHKKIKLIVGDVCRGHYDKYAQNNDFILHMATVGIVRSLKEIRIGAEVDIISTLKILEACKKYNRRFLYTSTTCVYGNQPVIPISEDAPIDILSPYAASKYAAECYVKAYHTIWDLPTTVVRYSNVYGPNQRTSNPYAGVVSKFIEASLNKKTIEIHGDGNSTRDYTYIDDAVEATLLALFNYKAIGKIYNIGTGIETSVNDLVKTIQNQQFITTVHIERRDIDNICRRAVNIDRIRTELRWEPTTTLKDGVGKTIKWMKSI